LNFVTMNDLAVQVKDIVLGAESDAIRFTGDRQVFTDEAMIETKEILDPSVPEVLRNAAGYEDAKDIVMNDEGLYDHYQFYLKETEQQTADDPITYFLQDEFGMFRGSSDQGKTMFNKPQLITEGDYTDYKEMVFQLPVEGSEFTQGHYKKYPNTFAHARFNTREIDGKKTLFIEELQSDWIRKGRDEGFKNDKEYSQLREEQQKLFEIQSKIEKEIKEQGFDGTEKQKEEYFEAKDRYDEIENILIKSHNNAVPDIPFKKNWQDIVLKRLIRYASENGFDAIAMTGGSIQADRYDLSKHIQKLEAILSQEGYMLKAYDHRGLPVIDETGIPENELSDYVGKEMADKIIGKQKRGGMIEFKGLDLKIGGEGLKSMYDKIFSKSLNKIGKKFDAKVEYLDSLNKDLLNDWSKLEKLYDKINNALDDKKNLWSRFKPGELSNQTREINEILTKKEAEIFRRLNKKFQEDGAINKPINDPTNKNIWFMDLTPSMKKKAIEAGFPIAYNKPVSPLFQFA